MKKRISDALFAASATITAILVPSAVSAHEVYVLSAHEVDAAMSADSPSPLLAFFGNESQFFFWGLVCAIVFSTLLFASIFRSFEARMSALFAGLKRFAHPIVRITAGACLLVYGVAAVLYGPELSIAHSYAGPVWQYVVALLGVCIIIGFQTRIAAVVALVLYLYALLVTGPYLLMYLHQAGAYVLLIILGGGPLTIDHHFKLGWDFRKRLERASAFAFPILRITFGVSVVSAAIFAKYVHSNLALTVIERYGLTAYFPFDPLFVVLGAFIIELLAGLMLILGIEIRWTALFLVFWLTLGHLYFKELWWVHLPLYGFGIAILCHGYDRYTLLGRFFKHRSMEPVL